ncbi:ATP-dependent DNA helicase DDX11 [Ischnura elegans]|uniref:ATP-dependent DNA helicase DDX11 n=1 Tax=Ischnura elegans TaxID=197161 RepID=UPI001ED8BFED|nr:ATP-dependent DNA helicase DDX11 [Ischnura elegans]
MEKYLYSEESKNRLTMADNIISLHPPEQFPFPFDPYPIQVDFMRNLYLCLENQKIGIFESPTGTGKSQSLICGSFRWLSDHGKRRREELENEIQRISAEITATSDSGHDWLTTQAQSLFESRRKDELEKKLKKLEKQDLRITEMKKALKQIRSSAVDQADLEFQQLFGADKHKELNGKSATPDSSEEINSETDFVLEDYGSDQDSDDTEKGENEDDSEEDTKIIFCSRTHSQLSQFVGEVRRSPYGESTRLVSLASRQSLCINPHVNKLRSQALINERCLELQKNKKGRPTKKSEGCGGSCQEILKRSRTSAGCPFLRPAPLKCLTQEIIVGDGGIADVEDLVLKGKKIGACPYYAARAAVKDAQVVVVPYNTLLHRSTRNAIGLQLRGNVVIVDEAHNLLDTVEHIHSAEVFGNQLTHGYSQLKQYHQKYCTRFSAKNLLNLKQLMFVIGKLIKILGGVPDGNPMDAPKGGPSATKLLSLLEFISSAEIDSMNLYNLQEFIAKSKVVRKVQGFSEVYKTKNDGKINNDVGKNTPAVGIKAFLKEISNQPQEEKNIESGVAVKESPVDEKCGNNPLLPVIAFLEGLTNRAEDGRVAITRGRTVGKGSLKYLLLNPASHLSDVVTLPRSIVLAGGTMQPISEFKEQLYLACKEDEKKIIHSSVANKDDGRRKSDCIQSNSSTEERILEFSCGHVVPAENVLPMVVLRGPSGRALDFSYQERSKPETINELGRVLLNMCNVIPAGIIIFFPSYDYEKFAFETLEKSGTVAKLELKKKVFREPKKASDVEKVLENFSSSIKNVKNGASTLTGAILLSVVGGKMSEGINFGNDLGRCVIMVGMPYPNALSPILQEKMGYLNTHSSLSQAGQRYYESLCMKAVNQSIGRCIRHKGDYATMLLLDIRYARPQTQDALPGWLKNSLVVQQTFGGAILSVRKFFSTKIPVQK